jgi:hypothetical protein
MEQEAFEEYSRAFVQALAAFDNVVGVVALGSTADPRIRDFWSDHDFAVVLRDGDPSQFLDDIAKTTRDADDEGLGGYTYELCDRSNVVRIRVRDRGIAADDQIERFILVPCQVAHSTPIEPHSVQNAGVLRQLACGVDHALRNVQMGDLKASASERNREAARPGSSIENLVHTVQPRRDLALQVCLLNDVVEEETLASRFLSRLGRKIPKSLTDVFRIWHGDTTPNDPIAAHGRRFAGNRTEGRSA